MRPRVIPILLLEDGGLVKTKKFSQPNYIGDPINAVKIFNNLEVDELILVDRMASKRTAEPEFNLLKEIASELFIPLAYGGGISSLIQMEKLFYLGIEKLVLNSLLFSNPALVQQAVKEFGSQSIVGSLDILSKKFFKPSIYNHISTKKRDKSLVENIQLVQDLGIGELVIQFVDRDGSMNGYDTSLIQKISPLVKVPLVVCGGAGNLNDFSLAIKAGADAAAAGSLFVYTGKTNGILINYPSQEKLDKIFT